MLGFWDDLDEAARDRLTRQIENVDFDLIGQVDAETFKVRKLSFFAELIWESRMKRSRATIEQNRPEMDWVVVRNRTGHMEARNQVRIEKALKEMARRVGFRVQQGLSERVIYRDLDQAQRWTATHAVGQRGGDGRDRRSCSRPLSAV